MREIFTFENIRAEASLSNIQKKIFRKLCRIIDLLYLNCSDSFADSFPSQFFNPP